MIALGATAAQTLTGPAFRVTVDRGRRFEVPWAGALVATIHPSAILRMPAGDREAAYAAFVADLRVAAEILEQGGTGKPRRRANRSTEAGSVGAQLHTTL